MTFGTTEFYKYVSFKNDNQHYLENYLKQKVYFAPLGDANDPFEGACRYKTSCQEVINGKAILNAQGMYIEDELDSCITLPNLGSYVDESNRQIKKWFDNNGMLCFSSDPVNIPMWAYYGDNHKGYCVVFEFDWDSVYRLMLSPRLQSKFSGYIKDALAGRDILSFGIPASSTEFVFTKVNYKIELPEIDREKFASADSNYLAKKCLSEGSIGVKFFQWAHEKEYRFVANKIALASIDKEGHVPFLRVKGIILGARMCEENKKTVRDLCREYKIDCRQATISQHQYKVII